MEKRFLDVLNKDGMSTGEKASKEYIHNNGLWHKSIHIWIINDKNEVLIQKRHSSKSIRPNEWTCSCAGHIYSEETLGDSISRQIKEELGIDFKSSFIIKNEKYKQEIKQITKKGNQLINNEFVDVVFLFTDISNSTINFNDSEISEIEFLPRDNFISKIKNNHNIFIPDQEIKILKKIFIEDDVILNQKYRTPFGSFEKIVLENEPTLRMIMTGRCNLNCEFCVYKKENFNSSEVKSDELVDFSYSDELIEMYEIMRTKYNYTTIHLTGGEPTMCNDLKNICIKLKEHGFKINIITNLINLKKVEELYENECIDELTFSYVPKDKEPYLRDERSFGYKTIDDERNDLIKKNALTLREKYNAILKTNIVSSGLTDIEDAIGFIRWSWENNITPRMQRDRSDDRISGSTKAVQEILNLLNVNKTNVIIRVPGATEICNFVDPDGNKISVKIFNKNFRFQEICKHCEKQENCEKAISSIRVFNKKDGPKLCFCNALDSEHTVFCKNDMPNLKVLDEIKKYKENKKIYFDKFCINPEHQ